MKLNIQILAHFLSKHFFVVAFIIFHEGEFNKDSDVLQSVNGTFFAQFIRMLLYVCIRGYIHTCREEQPSSHIKVLPPSYVECLQLIVTSFVTFV